MDDNNQDNRDVTDDQEAESQELNVAETSDQNVEEHNEDESQHSENQQENDSPENENSNDEMSDESADAQEEAEIVTIEETPQENSAPAEGQEPQQEESPVEEAPTEEAFQKPIVEFHEEPTTEQEPAAEPAPVAEQSIEPPVATPVAESVEPPVLNDVVEAVKPEQFAAAPAIEAVPSQPEAMAASVSQPPVGEERAQSVEAMPPSKGKKSMAPLVVVIVAVLLIAVGGLAFFSSASNPSTDDDNQDEKVVVEKNVIESITVGIDSVGFELFPKNTIEAENNNFNQQIFEGLVGYESGTKVVPLLAESWVNPDEKTWVFTLKQDVKFHNGNMMTASDVVFSHKQFVKLNPDLADVFASTIESVVADGDYKVTITTKDPDPILLNKLAFLYVIDEEAASIPSVESGTGPYVLAEGTKITETKVEMVAFADYHGGKVEGVQKLTMTNYGSEAEAQKAAEAGEIDIIQGLKDSAVIEAITNAGFQERVTQDPAVTYIGINSKKADSPLAKLEVRQAIALAFDSVKLLEAYGRTGEGASQFVTADIPGFNPSIKVSEQDIEQAKKLLADAEYSDEEIEFTYFMPVEPVAKEIISQLEAIGLNVKADAHEEGSTLGPKIFGSGEVDLWFASYSTDVYDAIDVYSFLFDDATNYSNEDVSELISKAASSFESSQRLKDLQAVAAEVDNDMAAVPLYTRDWTIWYRDSTWDVERDYPGLGTGILFKNMQHK